MDRVKEFMKLFSAVISTGALLASSLVFSAETDLTTEVTLESERDDKFRFVVMPF